MLINLRGYGFWDELETEFNNAIGSQVIFEGGEFKNNDPGEENYTDIGEVVIEGKRKKPSWFKRLTNYIKGFKFHFDMEYKVTLGPQYSFSGMLGKQKVNLFSAVMAQGKADVTLDESLPNGGTGKVTEYHLNEHGIIEQSEQGISWSGGMLGGEIERSWDDSDAKKPLENIKVKANYGMLEFEHNIPQTPNTPPNPHKTGVHLNLERGFRFGIGIEFKTRIGFTHD